LSASYGIVQDLKARSIATINSRCAVFVISLPALEKRHPIPEESGVLLRRTDFDGV